MRAARLQSLTERAGGPPAPRLTSLCYNAPLSEAKTRMQSVGVAQPGVPHPASGLSATDRDRLAARLFTIGHSNHELDRFLNLLRRAGVTAIADVRSSPFSQRYPQFNQPQLRQALGQHRVGYIHLGDELGGRPGDAGMYDGEGRVDYWRVRQGRVFRAGLVRLLEAVEDHAVAMLCTEEDPLECHRGLMICPELVEHGIRPRHVRGNGSLETTPQLELRLSDLTGVGRGILDGLFAASVTPEERASLIAEAYRVQARRRAFRLAPGEGIGAIAHTEEFAAE